MLKTFFLHFANVSGCLLICLFSSAQPKNYSTANAHSHNDYENPVPFYTAYDAHFGSIEADIFLENGKLFVAHDTNELKKHRTLEQYYLNPLLHFVQHNNGYAYPDSTAPLQMLIDIKTDSIHTLNKLIETLGQFSALISNGRIKWVITGNRPAPKLFNSYPSFILFDGELAKKYNNQQMKKIVMLSADFKNYSSWTGVGNMATGQRSILTKEITKAHRAHKPIRFWDAPDTIKAWTVLMQLHVDFINTDHINDLTDFIHKK
ncbi:MAG TPA: phosphatidylinositol-specific phospholipase C/glycerophosphodiester phosphodiesterase family protein [Puia sp.]|nr:phosphatidylinositol-specific phospholipase C/glycerophosphodiester phosphodiesterase family protein [Puia sp.]